ncbi:MAG TPA: rhomboid family intramembrane serine protease [Anaerolineales bacterium]
MNQYPPPSQEPAASYGGQPPQPGAPGPAAPRTVRLALPTSVPYVTYTIIGITVVMYLLQLGSTYLLGYADAASQLDWLEAYGARINDLIRAGQLWRLLTPVLLHASVPHILFNMWALYLFGSTLERHFGPWRFLVLYVLGGFAGNVLSFLLSTGYSVGASTAIFGLVGAEGVFLFQNRQLFGTGFRRAIGNVIFVVVVNLLLGLTPGIDNWGHVGGLIGGLLFAWFAGPVWELGGMMGAPELRDRRELRDVVTGAAAVIVIFGGLAVWGMLAPITHG